MQQSEAIILGTVLAALVAVWSVGDVPDPPTSMPGWAYVGPGTRAHLPAGTDVHRIAGCERYGELTERMVVWCEHNGVTLWRRAPPLSSAAP